MLHEIMTIRDERREAAIERMADHMLSEGLGRDTPAPGRGGGDQRPHAALLLRRQGRAAHRHAGADRHANDGAARRRHPAEPRKPFPVLLEQVWAALASENLRPYMPLWLDLASGAARGLQPHRDVAGEIADGFLAWATTRLQPERRGVVIGAAVPGVDRRNVSSQGHRPRHACGRCGHRACFAPAEAYLVATPPSKKGAGCRHSICQRRAGASPPTGTTSGTTTPICGWLLQRPLAQRRAGARQPALAVPGQGLARPRHPHHRQPAPRRRRHHVLEQEACDRYGVKQVYFVVWSREAPSREQVLGAKALFDELEYPAMMHCKSGADRAGRDERALHALPPEQADLRGDPPARLEVRPRPRGPAPACSTTASRNTSSEVEPLGISYEDWVKSPAYDPAAIKQDIRRSGGARCSPAGVCGAGRPDDRRRPPQASQFGGAEERSDCGIWLSDVVG